MSRILSFAPDARPAVSVRHRTSVGTTASAARSITQPADPGCLGRDPYSWGFDPIVDVARERMYAQEALVPPPADPGDGWALDLIQAARCLEVAARLTIDLPRAGVHDVARTMDAILEAAQLVGLPVGQIIFEIPNEEWVPGQAVIRHVLADYRGTGFAVALDHFGAGYAGLGALAEFHPDMIKIDSFLIEGIHDSRSKQAAVKGILSVARDLHIDVVAMGVEEVDEASWLQAQGVRLMQGPYVAALCPI